MCIRDSLHTVPADAVIVATGLIPDDSVAEQFRAAGHDPVVIGDAAGVGYLEGAIHAGFRTALDL